MFTDKVSNDDILGRKEFAKIISNGIFRFSEKNSDGFVTAVTGKWGVGKSTLMGFVTADLKNLFKKNNVDYRLLDFNPWMFSGDDEIKKAFLLEYAKAFEGYNKKRFIKIAKTTSLRFLKTIGSALIKAKSLALVDTKEVENRFESLIKKYTTSNSLSLKKDIDELLSVSNRKIIVCIDDIDRLPPKQVFELFQLLKLTCNFKNTFYLIAYDRDAVELSIESQFKAYGKKFLDKIVQAEFLVPEITKEKVQEIFFEELKKLLSELDIAIDLREFTSIWNFQKLKHFFTTLRDIYRYLNSLRFSLPIIYNEVNLIDFLLIEAIRQNNFEVYNMIYEEYGKIIFSFGNTDAFSDEKKIKEIQNPITRNLITYLFPLKPNIHSNKGKKRIYESTFFERYFSLQINRRDILQSELDVVFANSVDRGLFFQRIFREDRFDNFLDRFNDEIASRKNNDFEFDLINDLFDFFTSNADRIEKRDTLADTIINLLEIKPDTKEEYFRLFFDKLLNQTNYFDKAKFYFLSYLIKAKNKLVEMPSLWYDFISYCIPRGESLEIFYLDFLKKWSWHIFSPDSIKEPKNYFTHMFILDFSHFFREDYKQYLKTLLMKKENLLIFVDYLVIGGIQDGPMRIKGESFDKYLPDEMKGIFIENLKKLDTKRLSKSEFNAYKQFINDEI